VRQFFPSHSLLPAPFFAGVGVRLEKTERQCVQCQNKCRNVLKKIVGDAAGRKLDEDFSRSGLQYRQCTSRCANSDDHEHLDLRQCRLYLPLSHLSFALPHRMFGRYWRKACDGLKSQESPVPAQHRWTRPSYCRLCRCLCAAHPLRKCLFRAFAKQTQRRRNNTPGASYPRQRRSTVLSNWHHSPFLHSARGRLLQL